MRSNNGASSIFWSCMEHLEEDGAQACLHAQERQLGEEIGEKT